MTNKQLRAEANAKVDDAIEKLNRETEQKASGLSWLFQVAVWVGIALIFFFVVKDYLKDHSHIMGNPNP